MMALCPRSLMLESELVIAQKSGIQSWPQLVIAQKSGIQSRSLCFPWAWGVKCNAARDVVWSSRPGGSEAG